MARLFVAVWPPPPVLAVLRNIERVEQPGVRWLPEENWHVTLRFLGETDPVEVGGRLDDATLVATTATLGPKVRKLGRDAVVVPVDGLQDVAASITAATADIGRPPGRRPFDGHVTLARLRRGARPRLSTREIRARFDVHEVALVQSHLSATGARYEILRQWPTDASS